MSDGRIGTMTGRERRLAELYWQHAPEAVRLAYLVTGDRHTAEDIAQDAFIRVFGRFQDLRKQDSFRAYLQRTIVNLSRDRFRRLELERRQTARDSDASRTVDATSQVDDREMIREALLNLPHRQRVALILRFHADLSEQDAADVLHCSVPALKSLVARGTASLSERVRGEET